ncbi:MATE family efflux transporter [Pseudomonas trivialis]|uniref:Multidrug transporter n=1 Tax=Pseudomonas trivialis TaxID=200450 RepID=A0A0H5A685_9PSED|nr:MATE family efflux transporter [Pseudomonas trivialis]AKS06411.1 multidrug transporter [Pseudomonas trivialis]
MDILKLSIPLVFSRLGDMVASLLYFFLIGNYFSDFLSQASLAWSVLSFITVIGIGFFSFLLVRIAAASNLTATDIKMDIIISLRSSLGLGLLMVSAVFLYSIYGSAGSFHGADLLILLSLSIPAIYLQIVIFNFFNALKETKCEVFCTWGYNACVSIVVVFFISVDKSEGAVLFVAIYVVLRWVFAFGSLIFFRYKMRCYIPGFDFFQKVPTLSYASYFCKGTPLALCFGGESFLFLILSMISMRLGESSISSYQSTLHFLSVIYMLSIGVGNATGIVIARYYKEGRCLVVKGKYCYGLFLGWVVLFPVLLFCFFFNEYISDVYSSDAEIRRSIEVNILISLPFLMFEYFYIVTRMTLRSMGDVWVPTGLTIFSLNVLGIFFTFALFEFYEYNVQAIFIALALCSFVLMVLLFQRFKRKLNEMALSN